MTAMTFPILAIDLGKYKSIACAYDPSTAESRFETLSTSRSTLKRVFVQPFGGKTGKESRDPAVFAQLCRLTM